MNIKDDVLSVDTKEEVSAVNIKEEVLSVIENSVKISKDEISLDEKLQDIGVSSIDFFTMILDLTKLIGVEITDLDPTKVSVNMNVNELISFLNSKMV